MTNESATVCQLNEFLKGFKAEYSKAIASQSKRVMFLLDERNFIPDLSINADPETLKSVFGILIHNAIKYTNKGYIKVGYRVTENNMLQFFVEDTGKGFDSEALEAINGKLASSVNDTGEITENLPGANRLVKKINGKMRLESKPNMGTTVYFSIDYRPENVAPAADEEVHEEETAPASVDTSPQTNSTDNIWEGRTILIAEDETVNYMFLEVLFEETGAILIHACDGQEAINAVKSNPKIEIALMDIKMPNVNGLEATRQIKTIRPSLPIIAQTAYAMQDDEYKALQAGCNDYVSKPIDVNKLLNLMKKYLK